MHDVHEIIDRWNITTDGDKLRVEGASKLDSSSRLYIKDHKAEIIRLLQQKPVEPDLKPCPICNGCDFNQGHKGGYFCPECQPGHEGQTVKAGSGRPKPDTITGYPCGNCKVNAYLPAPDGYQMPDGEQVDGWKCTGCGMVFLMTGNRQVDARHKAKLLGQKS